MRDPEKPLCIAITTLRRYCCTLVWPDSHEHDNVYMQVLTLGLNVHGGLTGLPVLSLSGIQHEHKQQRLR
jgi:hypothetical protein